MEYVKRNELLLRKWIKREYANVLLAYIKPVEALRASKITLPIHVYSSLAKEAYRASQVARQRYTKISNPHVDLFALSREKTDELARKTVALIQTIPDRDRAHLDKVASAFLQGEPVNLQAEVSRIATTRAKVIARDQQTKLVLGAAREVATQEAGARTFIWRTAGDERVRPEHEANDGQEFDYDNPPEETGLPGDDVLCRCYDEPQI